MDKDGGSRAERAVPLGMLRLGDRGEEEEEGAAGGGEEGSGGGGGACMTSESQVEGCILGGCTIGDTMHRPEAELGRYGPRGRAERVREAPWPHVLRKSSVRLPPPPPHTHTHTKRTCLMWGTGAHSDPESKSPTDLAMASPPGHSLSGPTPRSSPRAIAP